MSYCPNCKTNDGPHYVPPMTGDPGFFMCGTDEEIFEAQKKAYLNQYLNYSGGYKVECAKEWLLENNVPLPERVFL